MEDCNEVGGGTNSGLARSPLWGARSNKAIASGPGVSEVTKRRGTMFWSWVQLEIMKGARITYFLLSLCLRIHMDQVWFQYLVCRICHLGCGPLRRTYMRSCWLILFVKCCIFLNFLGNNSHNSSRRVIVSLLICFIFEVLEKGSGEDLAVFCRSVISYCEKRGVEVGTNCTLV